MLLQNQVTVGVIGMGRIGRLHIEHLNRHPQVILKAVADLRAEDIGEWASQQRIGVVTQDAMDVIRDPEIDAVLICSSTDSHVELIAAAAEAGKHIFCEKPVSLDFRSTYRALQAVQASGVKFQIGFNRRFDPNFRRVKEIVASGEIGEPQIIKITSRDPNPPSYDYVKVSGGMFMDMAIHDFDMARYLAGSEVTEVYVKAAVLVDPVIGELGDVDTAVMTLQFENGALGVIDNSRQAAYGYDQRVEVFGSKGQVNVQNDFPNSAELSTRNGVYKDTPKHFFMERYETAYRLEMESFIDAVLRGGDVLIGGEDGYKAELLAACAAKSWKEKRPVKVSEISVPAPT